MSRAAALLAALALAGCGGSNDEPIAVSDPTTVRVEEEAIERLPDLPRSWHSYVNGRGGFALGLPPGWKAEGDGASVLIRSYDQLVAISVVPERSPEGLEVPISDYVTRAADAIDGFRGGLEPKGMFQFPHRYSAREVRATGTTDDGIDENVSVIVLRRDGLVTLTSVIAANAQPAAERSARLAETVLRTLRTRPPSAT